MILTADAIKQIKDKDVRRLLCEELDLVDQTILQYARKNENNGPLTTYGAVRVVREFSGLTDEQILQEKPVKKARAKAS